MQRAVEAATRSGGRTRAPGEQFVDPAKYADTTRQMKWPKAADGSLLRLQDSKQLLFKHEVENIDHKSGATNAIFGYRDRLSFC